MAMSMVVRRMLMICDVPALDVVNGLFRDVCDGVGGGGEGYGEESCLGRHSPALQSERSRQIKKEHGDVCHVISIKSHPFRALVRAVAVSCRSCSVCTILRKGSLNIDYFQKSRL